jgi:predicted MFS family arabinose efflux permease
MGLLFAGYAVCAGISVLVWGPLSDRFGRKKGLQGGLVIFTLGSAIAFFASGFHELLLGRIVSGMGSSMLSLNSISYAADFFPYQRRGWAMGAIFSSYFAAMILGVPIGAFLGEQFGWNAVFGVMGVIACILLFGTWRMLPGNIQAVGLKQGPMFTECVRRYGGFIKNKGSCGALASSFFASAGMMGFISFLGKYLHDSFNVSSADTGLVFLVFGTAAIVASPLAGTVSDKIGKRLQFILSSIILALFLIFLPYATWGTQLFILLFFISVSAAFRQGPMEAVFSEIVPSANRGMFIAMKNSFSQLGVGLATLLAGILFERVGFSVVCILASVTHILAVACILLTFRERHL